MLDTGYAVLLLLCSALLSEVGGKVSGRVVYVLGTDGSDSTMSPGRLRGRQGVFLSGSDTQCG